MGGDGRGNLRVAKADNDAARRVATSFEDWENRIEAAVFGAQCGSQMISPQRPTVGAGSSQREDSPARRLPAIMPIPWLPRGLPSMGINGLYHGAAHRVG